MKPIYGSSYDYRPTYNDAKQKMFERLEELITAINIGDRERILAALVCGIMTEEDVQAMFDREDSKNN